MIIARRHVVVERHRVAVDRLRVQLRVAAPVERDPRQLFLRRAVLVEVRLREHRDPDGRRRRRERQRPLHEPAGLEAAASPAAGHDRRATAAALRRAFPHGTEAQHVIAHARADGHDRLHHRAELPGASRVRCRTSRRSGAARPVPRTHPRRRTRPACPSAPDTSRARRCRRASGPRRSIAARHASSVSSNGSRPSRRPMSDWPTPLMHASITRLPLRHRRPPDRARTAGCRHLRRGRRDVRT